MGQPDDRGIHLDLFQLATLYALQLARAVFIPVMVGILFSYALSPIVDWLEQRGIPRGLGAALLVLGQVSVVALITFFLLASGDRFRRKVVKLAGPNLSNKRVTLQALNQIHEQCVVNFVGQAGGLRRPS